ncbi:hypothetical protein [Chromobacterium paludis]|uniref:Uncharacterized protein n=1 Tax=Chromobacterium paludis TaxID=2605945 RepID=A0A5C1DE05_9NEIS|nr:hypothetical protein [Chromobacterium paludis]QEL54994.1 hypothetical protein FYK34_05150 [Chromobacterium paludis]
MRDPQGSIRFEQDQAIRSLRTPLTDSHFLKTHHARKLVEQGALLDFQFHDAQTITSPRLPFISYPHEWSQSQLYDAARLTQDINRDLAENGWELKDASAWNILFQGCQPVFCDHLSFRAIAPSCHKQTDLPTHPDLR